MTKYLTGRFTNIVMLLVGVCLIGSTFHVHQLHPVYSQKDANIPQHLSVDQPICVACLNLMQAISVVQNNGDTIRHESTVCRAWGKQYVRVDFVSDRNNKSPPVIAEQTAPNSL
jgi:hypothetical protein